jgi:hypothetical protein
MDVIDMPSAPLPPNKRVKTSRNPAGRKIQETPEEKISD